MKYLSIQQFDEKFKVGDLFTTKRDQMDKKPPYRYVSDEGDMFYGICTVNPFRIILARKDGVKIHKVLNL